MIINSKSMNNTMTINQQENKYQDQKNNNGVDYYNNYNISHGTGRIMPTEAGERIRDAYIDNVCDRMTAAAAHMIEEAFQAGMTVEDIILAIEDTGLAPRPSPAYLKAILATWAKEGYTVSRLRREVHPCKGKPWWK